MQFELSYARDEVYECGAALLTVLACAKATDDEKCLQLYLSLCAEALWLKYSANREDRTPILVRPRYLFRDRKIIGRHLKFVAKRLRERLIAGTMALPFVREAKVGPIDPLPGGIERISVNQIAEHPLLLEDAGHADAQNLKKRFWAPSRPVIHLATAVIFVGEHLHKGRKSILLQDFLFDRLFVEAVMRQAAYVRILMARHPKFSVRPDQLIDFRLD